ncbi:uncharacterized protein LOC122247055 [Penaeus japonicus]|uniref:uncharacterized protein LOC122247055 n=1 Tax=Penaeus japonicus TaxID=27405 RepID=UPI001C710830|nr:uncharacterized protein LOC122247055 [Penaeus japonicus]
MPATGLLNEWYRSVPPVQRGVTEKRLSHQRFGFMSGRSTTDAIFALGQLIEKYRGQKDLHSVFIGLGKAYDRIPRQEVSNSLRLKEVEEKQSSSSRMCIRVTRGGRGMVGVVAGSDGG